MKKNELGKIPFGDCPKLIIRDQSIRFIAEARIVKQDKNKILLLSLWDDNKVPYARVFVDKKENNWSIQFPDGKWKKSTLLHLIYGTDSRWRWSIDGSHVKTGNETKKTIFEYFKKNESECGYCDPSALTIIQSFMADINNVKNIKTRKKKRNAFDTVLKNIPDLPKDIDEWVRSNIITEKYMFYETKSRYQIGHCSHCGKDINLTENMQIAKHNEFSCCPACGVEVQYKSSGMSRKKLIHRSNFGFVSRKENDIYVQVVEAEQDYGITTGRVNTNYTNLGIYYITEGEAYEWHRQKASCWWGWNCHSRETYPSNWVQSKIPPSLTETTYPYDQSALIRNSPFEHCGWEIYKKHNSHANFIRYLCTYAKYPSIEYLQKLNLHNLVRERVNFGYVSSVNWKGSDLKSVLRIKDKSELPLLVKNNISGLELDIYQKLKAKGEKILFEDLKYIINYFIRKYYSNGKDAFLNLLKYTSHKKIINYTRKQKKNNPQNYQEASSVLMDWKDYIEECKKLNYEITEQILFPKSLHEAHARTSSIIEYENNKEKNKAVETLSKKLIKKYSFEDDDFIIKVPSSVQELVYEGKMLKHCVGGYASKLKLNTCEILFVRKKDEPDSPFYTMEVSNKRIVQVRTLGNRMSEAGSDVQAFIDKFKAEKLNKNIKEKVAV